MVESFVWSHKIYSFEFLDPPELYSQIIYAIKAGLRSWGLARELLFDSAFNVHEGNSKTFETSAARWHLETQGLVLKALDRADSSNPNEFFPNMGPRCGIRKAPLILLNNHTECRKWGNS